MDASNFLAQILKNSLNLCTNLKVNFKLTNAVFMTKASLLYYNLSKF